MRNNITLQRLLSVPLGPHSWHPSSASSDAEVSLEGHFMLKLQESRGRDPTHVSDNRTLAGSQLMQRGSPHTPHTEPYRENHQLSNCPSQPDCPVSSTSPLCGAWQVTQSPSSLLQACLEFQHPMEEVLLEYLNSPFPRQTVTTEACSTHSSS